MRTEINQGLREEKKCCPHVSYPITTDDLMIDMQEKKKKLDLYMRSRKIRAAQQTTRTRAHSIVNKPYLGHTAISIVSSKEVLKFWAHSQRASFFLILIAIHSHSYLTSNVTINALHFLAVCD